jgi:chemotaxis methyl-accepting protein methylase
MPEVTRDELGRRVFQLNKEKAVESSIEKIRRTLGPEWNSLTVADIEALKYVLEEMWISLSRDIWEKYSFTRLRKTDVERIIELGNDLKEKKIPPAKAIDEFNDTLSRSK